MAPSDAPKPPVLDLDAVQRRLMVPEDFLVGALCDFLDKYGDVADQVSKLLVIGATEAAERTAHNLTGLAGTLGASSLQASAARVEAAVRDGDEAEIAASFAELTAAMAAVTAEIGVILARRGGSAI